MGLRKTKNRDSLKSNYVDAPPPLCQIDKPTRAQQHSPQKRARWRTVDAPAVPPSAPTVPHRLPSVPAASSHGGPVGDGPRHFVNSPPALTQGQGVAMMIAPITNQGGSPSNNQLAKPCISPPFPPVQMHWDHGGGSFPPNIRHSPNVPFHESVRTSPEPEREVLSVPQAVSEGGHPMAVVKLLPDESQMDMQVQCRDMTETCERAITPAEDQNVTKATPEDAMTKTAGYPPLLANTDNRHYHAGTVSNDPHQGVPSPGGSSPAISVVDTAGWTPRWHPGHAASHGGAQGDQEVSSANEAIIDVKGGGSFKNSGIEGMPEVKLEKMEPESVDLRLSAIAAIDSGSPEQSGGRKAASQAKLEPGLGPQDMWRQLDPISNGCQLPAPAPGQLGAVRGSHTRRRNLPQGRGTGGGLATVRGRGVASTNTGGNLPPQAPLGAAGSNTRPPWGGPNMSTPDASPALSSTKAGGAPLNSAVPQLMSPVIMPLGRRSSSPRLMPPFSHGGMSPLVMISPLAVPRFTQQRSSFGVSPLQTVSPMNRVGASPLGIAGSPHRDAAGGRLPASPVVAYVNYMPPPMTPEGEYIPAPVGQARERCNCARTKCDTRRCKCYREKRPCVGCNCVDCNNLHVAEGT